MNLKNTFLILFIIFLANCAFAQHHTPLPHGMVFGTKPSVTGGMPADKIETFMGKRTRTTTVIIGKILNVAKSAGGWFDMDAGNGKVIAAHFKDANVNLPKDIKGREVIIEGVAQKDFIADDLQHMAGDTVRGKQQHHNKTDPKRRLTFEVKGLMVNR
ncbi:DUF4920 domain-containing protein [Mucilaginibacter ginkgonis]|uniref:DUF4920 domain-containing protein n=1 Tax=Mucilaginibacter ginkgonis TaxID=2682091 RepID=A0A6I4I0D6_9SPHI|nr:DUF4920 domain-containing protein [Mucilaginibacter ginkgonis]QQL49628.1 DUF4920 domain-containing protein [Mucilaginibacter ginkgonis]